MILLDDFVKQLSSSYKFSNDVESSFILKNFKNSQNGRMIHSFQNIDLIKESLFLCCVKLLFVNDFNSSVDSSRFVHAFSDLSESSLSKLFS